MADQSTMALFADEVAHALEVLVEPLTSDEAFAELAHELGWDLTAPPPPVAALADPATDLQEVLEAIAEPGSPTPPEVAALLTAVTDFVAAIHNLEDATFDPTLTVDNFAQVFPRQLLDHAAVRSLGQRHPGLGSVLETLGIIRTEYAQEAGNRSDFMRREVVWESLPRLLDEPGSVFELAFGWGTPAFDGPKVLRILQDLFVELRVPAFVHVMSRDEARVLEQRDEPPELPSRWQMTASYVDRMMGPVHHVAGLRFLSLPADAPRLPGLAVMPYASAEFEEGVNLFEQLRLEVKSSLDLQGGVGIVVRPNEDPLIFVGLDDPSSAAEALGQITTRLVYSDLSAEPTVLLGSPGGSRFAFRTVAGRWGLRAAAGQPSELFGELEIQGAELVIAAGEGDSFLQRILPADGLEANFELTAGLSNLQGFYFRGSGGLELQLPIHLSLGLVEIRSLTVSLQPKSGTIPVNLGADVRAELGPLTAVVEFLGLTATFSFPSDNSGTLGPIDFDIGFKPPNGIGLSIDNGGFKGGGFLRFENDNQRYVGFLELEYQDRIALKAIGLLTTRLPEGREGFSLLIIITAEFTPVQLGFGFTLNGIGGLLGLNRTAKIERLRTGIKDNTLSSILFPQDIVANADRIISDLRQVFPPQADRFIFGPMAKIGWGSPTLLTIDLGLLIEVPDPVRVVILGVVRALLPNEDAKLLQLQVNFLGVIDFEAQRLSFDASLYDSKLLTYPLSGDMALRLSWGADPNFLLTVGGFHPAYDPPPMTLPNLRRLTLQLLAGNNPRLTLETYFAVTSNTVQFGARLELYAAAGKFNVYGFLSYDALFQFNPFYFIAPIGAMLALRIGSNSIASINLSLTLEGPTPWHAKGTAKFKICWFLTIKVRFNKTFGEERDTRLDDVAVLPLLKTALSDKGNWEAQIPDGRHLLVSLKQIENIGDDQVVAHPFGVLTITQKVVPLNIDIQKFGNQLSSDGNRFEIEQVWVGESGDTEMLGTANVQEHFAPAQFFEKSDAQKLSSKSFECYDGGVKLTASEAMNADYAASRAVEYELFYIDEQRNQRLRPWPTLLAPEVVAFNAWTSTGAIAASPLSFANNAKSALAPDEVKVSQEPFAVVNASDLRPVNENALVVSEAGANGLMNEIIRKNPALEGEIQVVPTFEVNRS